ncbi:MAG TPA: hypothetical protein ENI33_06505 [Thermoplasmatales archaeon]|nr:hypothetical protein [Thermoplasmatales archaeon]
MKEKTEKISIEKGLAAKIYLLAYPKPKSGYEIAKEIYGYDHHRVRKVIKKLAKEDYLISVKKDEWRYPKWLSSVEPLIGRIEDIKKQEDIELSDFEKHVIRVILNSQHFRTWIKINIPLITEDLRQDEIDALEIILAELEIHFITLNKLHDLAESVNEIKTVEDFDKLVESWEWLKSLEPKRRAELPKKYRNLIENNKEVLINLTVFYPIMLPKSFLEKIKGISKFGKKYHELEWFIEGLKIIQ